MKRTVILLLCVMGLLSGCDRNASPTISEMEQPVSFYYLSAESTYHASMGPLKAELRDLENSKTLEEMAAVYFSGPYSEELYSPFADGTAMEEVSLENGVLSLVPNDAFFDLRGADLSLAAACIVHTMTQFPDVEAVVLTTSQARITDLVNQELIPEDFVLTASPVQQENMVTLYFPAEDSRSLREEFIPFTGMETPDELAAFALRQLLNGSQGSGLSVFPEGTNLLDVLVDSGSCTINLSSNFFDNRPETALKTRMALLAAVNTLTAIEEIERVFFLCEGQTLTDYNGFDLSQPFIRDERSISTYSNSAERDVTLFLPYGSGEKLIAIPLQMRSTNGKSIEKDVLGALLAYEGSNGIENPIPEDTMIASLSVKNGLCNVTFNSVLALADNDPQQAVRAIHSIVSTLCALPTVDQVQISIDGNTMASVDLSQPMGSMLKWVTP